MNIERISQILIILTITYFLLGGKKKKERKIIKLYFALFFIPIIYQLSSKVTSARKLRMQFLRSYFMLNTRVQVQSAIAKESLGRN